MQLPTTRPDHIKSSTVVRNALYTVRREFQTHGPRRPAWRLSLLHYFFSLSSVSMSGTLHFQHLNGKWLRRAGCYNSQYKVRSANTFILCTKTEGIGGTCGMNRRNGCGAHGADRDLHVRRGRWLTSDNNSSAPCEKNPRPA